MDSPSFSVGIAMPDVLQKLANGQLWSFAELATPTHSATVLRQQLALLQAAGLPLHSPQPEHFQLTCPFEPLHPYRIQTELTRPVRTQISGLEVYSLLDSSNTYLLRQAQHGRVCFVEYQQAGRGQHGRQWQAPWGGSICGSIAYHYPQPPAFAELALALAIAITTALRNLLGAAIQIKWPNDIVWHEQKIGGLLLEARTLSNRCEVVFGIGLNYRLPSNFYATQTWTDLAAVLADTVLPSRNALAAHLINTCLPVLHTFPETGLNPYLTSWPVLDALAQRPITLLTPTSTVQGIALGIDEQAALRVNVDGTEQRYQWGQISVRY